MGIQGRKRDETHPPLFLTPVVSHGRFVIKSFLFIVVATFFHALISILSTWTEGAEGEDEAEVVKTVDMILLRVWLASWIGYVVLRRQMWQKIRAEHNGETILEEIRDSKWETSGAGGKLEEFMDGEIEYDELHLPEQ